MRRSNGEGTIYIDKSKKGFMAAITDPAGKRIKKRFNTREEASAWLATIRAEIYTESYVQPSNITLGQWCVEYLTTYCQPRIRPKTYYLYRHMAMKLEPLSKLPLQKITPASIQKLYNNLDLAESSKKQVHFFLGMLFRKAESLGIIKKNIMLAVDPPKYPRKEIEIFTTEEIGKILSTVKDHKIYCKYYPFFYLAATTGARLSELLGLKHKNVHHGYIEIKEQVQYLDEGFITVPPKTRSGIRKITITAYAEKLILSRKLRSFDGYVFCTRNGTPISHSAIEKLWRKILKIADVRYRNFHVLRHTHATQLLAVGVPILEVSKRLGHSSASHTLVLYGHAIPGYDAGIPEKIDQIMGATREQRDRKRTPKTTKIR